MLERAVAVERPPALAFAAWLEARKAVIAWWAASRAVVFAGAFALHLAHAPRG